MRECIQKNLVRAALDLVGSLVVRNSFWINDVDREIDIMGNGRKACALLVSRILIWFWFDNMSLCCRPHATVAGLEKELEQCGWYDIPTTERRPGSVIIWEMVRGNEHIGIGVSLTTVVSNCAQKCVPVLHSWDTETDNKTSRSIRRILWHNAL